MVLGEKVNFIRRKEIATRLFSNTNQASMCGLDSADHGNDKVSVCLFGDLPNQLAKHFPVRRDSFSLLSTF